MNQYQAELYHYGIKNQKWGVRRFQNEDGSLTKAGQKRYGTKPSWQDQMKSAQEVHERQRAAKQSQNQAQSQSSNRSNSQRQTAYHYQSNTANTMPEAQPNQNSPTSIMDSLISTTSRYSYANSHRNQEDYYQPISSASKSVIAKASQKLSNKKMSEVSVENETIEKVKNLASSISNETSKKKKTSSAYIGG